MRKAFFVKNTVIQTDAGENFTLQYYVCNTAKRQKKPVYGIQVEKYAANGILVEKNRTPAFTASRAEAFGWAGRFADGAVTPGVLLEMIDECL